MRKRVTVDFLLIATSIILYTTSIVLAQTISFVLGSACIIGLRIISIIFMLLVVLKRSALSKKEINGRRRNKYLILAIIMFLPYLWQNAQFEDGRWFDIISYCAVFLYSIVLSFVSLKPKEEKILFVLLVGFSVVTSLFTWLQVISSDSYYAIIAHLFPSKTVNENISFYKKGSLFGLTSHYSRNAFFIVVSIIFAFFSIKSKKKYVLLLFFLSTLLAVGKRGHLLFLVISAIISFFIIKRIKLATIIKFTATTLVIIGSLFLLSMKVPQIRHTFERMEESASSEDMTTGRSDMYLDAKRLYEQNGRIPIGWGKYASWTKYFHPALHNDYLQLYYEVGFIGELLIVVPNIIILVYAAKGARDGNSLASMALVYDIFFMTYSLTGLPHYDQETQFVYYILNSIMFTHLYMKGKLQNEN